nr:hypothetical protein [Tanacetum cinerariifolium]
MPSKDNLYNGRKGIGFENPSYFEKAKDLRPTLYDEKVIGLGYTLIFLTLSDEALEIEKFKRSRENKIEFAYDYGNLNASYVNEKINLEDDYFQEIINPDFEKIDSPFQQTSSVKSYVPNVILEKIIIDLEDEVVNLLEKEKVNLETIESLKSKGFESSEKVSSESENQSENDCLVVEKECDKKENPKNIVVVTSDPLALIAEKMKVSKKINENMVFMDEIEKVISDSEASSSSVDEKISEKRIDKANQQRKDFENQNKDLQDKYDVLKNQATNFEKNNKELNEELKELIEKNTDLLAQTKVLKDQLQVKHVVIDTHVECQEKYAKLKAERYEYMIRYSAYFDNDKQHRKQIADREVLYDKMGVQLVELDKHVRDLKNTVLEKTSKFVNWKNFSLKPYVPNVILEKIIIDLVDEVVNILEKEKANLETIESLKSKGFESSETAIFESKNQSKNDCLVIENECEKEENSKVIAPGMFKLSMSQSVSPISMSKTSCESNNVENKLKRKRGKRKSSKKVKQVDNDVSHANSDFVHFSNLDTFSSVRRPKNSGVIWKKIGSSNTSNVDLFAVSV